MEAGASGGSAGPGSRGVGNWPGVGHYGNWPKIKKLITDHY